MVKHAHYFFDDAGYSVAFVVFDWQCMQAVDVVDALQKAET